METPEQTECRRNKMALQFKERLNMETPEQTECRRMKMAHDMKERRNMNNEPTSSNSQTDWQRLDAMSDEDIDLSDCPRNRYPDLHG